MLMIAIFLAFRVMFFVLFNYRISLFLRQFSLWVFLFIMITDGNIQYLSYLFGFEMNHLFNFTFANKMSSVMVLILYFFLFIFSTCSFFLIRNYYGKLAKYLFDNAMTSHNGTLYLLAQIGYRAFN